MSGFIKFYAGSDLCNQLISAGKHKEFILLTVIARRARRTADAVLGLDVGQAMIGDYASFGMTRQQYRTAIENLKKWGIVTTKSTNKGTIATLVDSTVYDINAAEPNQQPTSNQPATNQQANQSATTNKNVKKEKKEKNVKNITLEQIGDVSVERAQDFIEHRQAIRKPLTQRAFDLAMSEANKAHTIGLTPDEAIDEAIEAGWQSLKIEWVANRVKKPQSNVHPIRTNGPRKMFPGIGDTGTEGRS